MKRILNILIYVIFLFLVLEGSSRLIHPLKYTFPPVQFAKVVPHPERVYAFQPSQEWEQDGIQFSTNSAGYRDNEFVYEKPTNVIRIAAMGDSVTYGWAVPREDSWPSRLESILNADCPSREFEMYNFGIPGYGTVQQAALIDEVLLYNPDVVLLQFSLNDFTLAQLSSGEEGFTEIFYLQEPFLITSGPADRVIILAARKSAFFALVSQALHQVGRKLGLDVEGAYDLLPERNLTFAALQTIEARSTLHGSSLIVWFHSGIDFNSTKTLFVDMMNVTRYESTRLIPPTEYPRDYFIDDIHPNEVGHRMIGESLFSEISKLVCHQ